MSHVRSSCSLLDKLIPSKWSKPDGGGSKQSATCALPCCLTSWLHNVILFRGLFYLLPWPIQVTYYITGDTLRSPLREEKSCGTRLLALSEPCNTMSAFSELTACLDQVYIHHAFIVKFLAVTRPPTGHLNVSAAKTFWTLRIINHLVSTFLPLTMLHNRSARSRKQGQGTFRVVIASKHIISNL